MNTYVVVNDMDEYLAGFWQYPVWKRHVSRAIEFTTYDGAEQFLVVDDMDGYIIEVEE